MTMDSFATMYGDFSRSAQKKINKTRRYLVFGSGTPLGAKTVDILNRVCKCLGYSCFPGRYDDLDLRDSNRVASLVCYERADGIILNLECLLPYLKQTSAGALEPVICKTLKSISDNHAHITFMYNLHPANSHREYIRLSDAIISHINRVTSEYAVFRFPALNISDQEPVLYDSAVLTDTVALAVSEKLDEDGDFSIREQEGLNAEDVLLHQKHCVFQMVYKLEITQRFRGHSVAELRYKLGKELAAVIPSHVKEQIDCVCPVPRTGLYYGMGLAYALDKPYLQGLVKANANERSFQIENADKRKKLLWNCLSPIPEILRGKRVALVDEAIFTGATLKVVCEMLLECGVKALYLCIPTPKCRYHCEYLVHPPRSMLLEYLKSDMLEDYFNCDGVYFQSDEKFHTILEELDPAMCADCFWGGDVMLDSSSENNGNCTST